MKTIFNTAGLNTGDTSTKRAQKHLAIEELPPLLRLLLSTDGTVTKSLEAYFSEPVTVENLGQAPVTLAHAVAALDLNSGDQAVQRRVRLCGQNTRRVYAYAESMLRLQFLPDGIRQDILVGKIGIGELLRERGLETYREMLAIGTHDAIEAGIFPPTHTDLVYRTYRIWIARVPTILITELFPVDLYRECAR